MNFIRVQKKDFVMYRPINCPSENLPTQGDSLCVILNEYVMRTLDRYPNKYANVNDTTTNDQFRFSLS